MAISCTPLSPKGPSIWYHLNHINQNRLDYISQLQQTYGDIVKLPSRRLAYLVSDPELIKTILHTQSHQFIKQGAVFKRAEGLLGVGLLTAQGEIWQAHRKIASPVFHAKQIDHYIPIVQQYTEQMLNRWHTLYAKPGIVFNLAEEMMLLVLRISGKILFNRDLIDLAPELIQLIHAGNRMAVRPSFSTLYLPTPSNLRFHYLKRRFDRLLLENIIEHPESAQSPLLNQFRSLRYASNQLSPSTEDILSEIKTLLVTGHETTGSILAWSWYLLHQQSSIAKRFTQEIDQALNAKLPTLADLAKLPFTRQIIDETLRLYPSIWLLTRIATQDVAFNNWLITKQTILLSCVYTLHRHPKIWEHPHTFNPDRFGPNATRPPKHCYIPFGLGPRACIAGNFTLMQTPLILAQIAQRYTIHIQSTPQPIAEPLISLRPEHGIWAKIQARSR